jgi:hypothetical protein
MKKDGTPFQKLKKKKKKNHMERKVPIMVNGLVNAL